MGDRNACVFASALNQYITQEGATQCIDAKLMDQFYTAVVLQTNKWAVIKVNDKIQVTLFVKPQQQWKLQ